MKNKNDFEYKYVAPTATERREIESIRNSYVSTSKSESKLTYLRKLDSKVRNTPTIISLILGVGGILLFGLGLTLILEWEIMIWGVIISVIGLAPTIFAYPVYLKLKNYLKNKYSDTIIKISDELLKNDK